MDRRFVLAVIFVSYASTPVYTAAPPPSITCAPGVKYVPHPSDCSVYYLCAYGRARTMLCSAGLEFSTSTMNCEDPSIANCNKLCDVLVNDAKGTWSPATCATGPSKVGTVCSIACGTNFELRGSSSINCIESGWNSTNGNFIPRCVDIQCISQAVKNTFNQSLSVPNAAGMLFVLDESGSVGRTDFIKTKDFVKDVVEAFPLSTARTAGVITFDDYPIVRIGLPESSTQNFKNRLGNIPYRGSGTDVLEALQGALQEIQRQRAGAIYLVILITDGISETDATPAANALKNANHPVFSIGVGQTRKGYVESLSSMGKNGIRHFFHTRSYDLLKSIGQYINPTNTGTATVGPPMKCP